MKNDLTKNKKVIYDPLTGGNQTIYWNDERTFFMSIPDRVLPLPKDYIPYIPKYKITDNEDGSKTWELLNP